MQNIWGIVVAVVVAAGVGAVVYKFVDTGPSRPSAPVAPAQTSPGTVAAQDAAMPRADAQFGQVPLTDDDIPMGKADAPITIVEYASLTCPHCRNFHMKTYPQFKKAYIDTGKVRYILREFPIGKTSGAATIALRCAKPEKYLELFGKFMDQQPAWVSQEVRLDPIFNVAAQVGMTRQQFDACRQNQSMIDGLKWVKDRGRKLGVIGTPNFFVEGKLVKKELTMEDIRAMVDPLLAGPATASAAGTPQ
jgi:protein-disulfide isomerase